VSKLLVISKAYGDIHLAIAAFRQGFGYDAVRILVFGDAARMEVMREAGVPQSSITVVSHPSEGVRLRRVLAYLRALQEEKRAIDRLITETRRDKDTEVLFFSYNMSPQSGYFLRQMSATNKVMFLDSIAPVPVSLPIRQWIKPRVVAMGFYRFMIGAVFGRIFGLAGTPEYPLVYLKPTRCRISDCPAGMRDRLLGARLDAPIRFPARGPRTAVVLYSNPFLCELERWHETYRAVLKALRECEFEVFVKIHPKSSTPDFLDGATVTWLPQHLPFELIELPGLSLVVGVDGRSMVDKLSVPTISLAKLLYTAGSEQLKVAMDSIRENDRIEFPESKHHLETLVRGVATGATAGPA
jgi:hypothetical protein